MADASIAVKMYFITADNPETNSIRRFNFDNNGSIFHQIIRKIALSMGDGQSFYIGWKDSENEMIRVDSDEELNIALQDLGGNGLLKLYVHISAPKSQPKVTFKDATDSGMSSARSTSAPAYKQQGASVHVGITCDGCNGAIVGTRYKCLSCPDYDLCGMCEAAAAHPQHDMIVVRDPENPEWKRLFAMGYPGRSSIRGGWPWGGRHGPRSHGPHGPCGPCPPQPGMGSTAPCGPAPGPRCGPWGGPHRLWQMAQMTPEQQERFEKERMEQRTARRAARKAAEETGGRRGPAYNGPTVELDVDLNRPLNEVLSNVNEQVLDALNKIAAARNATRTVPQPQENEPQISQSEQPTEVLQESVTEFVVPDTAAPAQIYPSLVQANATLSEFAEKLGVAQTSRAASATGDRTPSEVDNDWTFLAGSENDVASVTAEPTLAATPIIVEAAAAAYDPRVDAALKAMEEMGFKNEGNILRALLENYNGDIAKVLHTLDN